MYTGPPAASENWLYLRVGTGRLVADCVNGAAAKSGLRLYQSAVPCNSLVPLLVVALITPPPVVPYSAEKAEVCTVNSCTVSGVKLTMVRAKLTPVLLVPSAIIRVLIGRPPPTVRVHPGHGVPLVIVGFSLPASPLTFGRVSAKSRTLRLSSGTS